MDITRVSGNEPSLNIRVVIRQVSPFNDDTTTDWQG